MLSVLPQRVSVVETGFLNRPVGAVGRIDSTEADDGFNHQRRSDVGEGVASEISSAIVEAELRSRRVGWVDFHSDQRRTRVHQRSLDIKQPRSVLDRTNHGLRSETDDVPAVARAPESLCDDAATVHHLYVESRFT